MYQAVVCEDHKYCGGGGRAVVTQWLIWSRIWWNFNFD